MSRRTTRRVDCPDCGARAGHRCWASFKPRRRGSDLMATRVRHHVARVLRAYRV